MDLSKMIQDVKNHPDSPKMGMIASHLGVVRESSVKGGKVTEIHVTFDRDAINNIINETKKMQGIVEVLVDVAGGHLKVGDDIMAVVVGGDIRDHVFPALISAVNRIKVEASEKKEIF
ncbi:MAG: molybdenum cofactor biosynthesis protein MoaE [Thermodesulfobacteriota bacterium]|nr:molybdenum cofactor biosynthesis protein MoaE [Thermodesulfobacteriota bacterium]